MGRKISGTKNELLVRRARALPRVHVQNGLMRSGDREIALSMMYMDDPDRTFLLSLLPSAKVRRIREELALQQRLKITYNQYVKAISALTKNLESGRGGGSIRSYIRPVR